MCLLVQGLLIGVLTVDMILFINLSVTSLSKAHLVCVEKVPILLSKQNHTLIRLLLPVRSTKNLDRLLTVP